MSLCLTSGYQLGKKTSLTFIAHHLLGTKSWFLPVNLKLECEKDEFKVLLFRWVLHCHVELHQMPPKPQTSLSQSRLKRLSCRPQFGVWFSLVTPHWKLLYNFEMLHEVQHGMITKFFFVCRNIYVQIMALHFKLL